MKKSKFTLEQIAMALHQHEAGSPVGEVTPQTGGLGADLLPLEEEVWGLSPLRGPPVETTGRGEPTLEAAGGGFESGAHVTGGHQKKALRPVRVKAVARWRVDRFAVSTRRACRVVAAVPVDLVVSIAESGAGGVDAADSRDCRDPDAVRVSSDSCVVAQGRLAGQSEANLSVIWRDGAADAPYATAATRAGQAASGSSTSMRSQ